MCMFLSNYYIRFRLDLLLVKQLLVFKYTAYCLITCIAIARSRLNIFIMLRLSRFICISIIFYYFLLLLDLVTAPYLLEMLFFIIMLCTSTNIVKQVIENLQAHVHVGWKILLAPRKKYMHLCKCACLESSTECKLNITKEGYHFLQKGVPVGPK